MAAETIMEDIRVETVLVSDDVASAPPDQWQRRRGVAGLLYAYKSPAPPRRAWTSTVVRVTKKREWTARWAWPSLPCRWPACHVHHRRRDGDRHGHPARRVRRGPLEPPTPSPNDPQAVIEDLPHSRATVSARNGLGATPRAVHPTGQKRHLRGEDRRSPVRRRVRDVAGDGRLTLLRLTTSSPASSTRRIALFRAVLDAPMPPSNRSRVAAAA